LNNVKARARKEKKRKDDARGPQLTRRVRVDVTGTNEHSWT
jgi:hypothetical protein